MDKTIEIVEKQGGGLEKVETIRTDIKQEVVDNVDEKLAEVMEEKTETQAKIDSEIANFNDLITERTARGLEEIAVLDEKIAELQAVKVKVTSK